MPARRPITWGLDVYDVALWLGVSPTSVRHWCLNDLWSEGVEVRRIAGQWRISFNSFPLEVIERKMPSN